MGSKGNPGVLLEGSQVEEAEAIADRCAPIVFSASAPAVAALAAWMLWCEVSGGEEAGKEAMRAFVRSDFGDNPPS